VDKEHLFVHSNKVKDSHDISAAILLVTDITDHLEKHNSILGGACFCPRVHREQFGLHLGCGMLHHKVVDLLVIFFPPFLLIVGAVVLPVPFCCLDKVGRILRCGAPQCETKSNAVNLILRLFLYHFLHTMSL
jgi:hypothetical protein